MRMVMILLVLLFILFTACTPSEKQCAVDKDCVPSSCCHPTEAVSKENAPDCRGVLCTADCQPGTLNCNQGEIKCIKNKCTVILY